MAGTAGRSGGSRHLGNDRTESDGLPEAPEGRTEAFYSKWVALLADLPQSELRRIDAVQLAVLAEHMVELDQLNAMVVTNPADLKTRSLRLRVGQQIARLSSLFGLSPADRKRLSFEPPKPDDAFDTWLKGTGASK